MKNNLISRGLILFLVFLVFLVPVLAQVPPIGPSGCVAAQDQFLNVIPCGWEDTIWVVGFGIFILILIFFFFPKSTPPPIQPGQVAAPVPVAKKVVEKPKKPKEPTGKGPLALGILAIITSPYIPFGGMIFGGFAISKASKMKKSNKKSIAGMILGWLGIGITITAYLGAVFPSFLVFLIILGLLFWLFFFLKKKKEEKNYWGLASFVAGLLSMFTYYLPLSGIILGVAAIIFSKKQKNIKKTKLSKIGLIFGIVGIIAGIMEIIGRSL
ncbi:hypothetical protein ISS07_00015 [Candidatus Woesearchaeota archaeon]|nr:hypothetical protein [Candidatus Woesearchaeota archaeon]